MASTPGILIAVLLFLAWQQGCDASGCIFQLVNESDPTVARFTDEVLADPTGHICANELFRDWYPCRIDCVEWLGRGYTFEIIGDDCGCRLTRPEIVDIAPPDRTCKNFVIDKDSIQGGETGQVHLSCSEGISIREQNEQTICFNGQQSCNVPFFDGNDLGRKFELFFTFRHGDEHGGIESMEIGEQIVLWSHGHPTTASVLVAYNRTGIIVILRSPEEVVTEVFCEAHQAPPINGELRSRYFPYPQFNAVRVVYTAGMYVLGTRGSGVLIVTLNNGAKDRLIARRCYADSITAAPELKVADGPLQVPVSGLYGCLRRLQLKRECEDAIEVEEQI